jgi:HAMP domain-containing protein
MGQANDRIAVKGSDEICDLARAFERMRTSINLAISKLK